MTSATQSAFHHDVTATYRTINHATITQTVFERASMTYQGAVYDQAGALVFHSVRPGSPVSSYRPDISISRSRDPVPDPLRFDAAIYGGHFFYAWGHFLIETLSTAALADELPNVPVIFSPYEIVGQNDWTEDYQRHTNPILRAAGWGEREIIVSPKPMSVDRLYVPQRLTSFGVASPTVHPAMATIYDRVRSKLARQQSDETVVVMRSEDHRRWHPSERSVYYALSSRGAVTILPQNMGAEAQVASISRARTLIGFTGSVLHNSVFMARGTQVIEIGDRSERQTADPMQSELCRVCDQELVFVPGFKERPRSADDLLSSVIDASARS